VGERPPAVRVARAGEPATLGPLFVRAGFRAQLAEVTTFARARLGGEVFVAEVAGEPVGAAACAWFGATGWVGGVVVAPERRRAGLGAALTAAVVAHLRALGAATVLLLATELGRPVYQRLGFVPDGEYRTLAGPAGALPPAGDGVRPGRPGDLAAVLALDRAATGEDRGRLLGALWPRGGLVAVGGGGPRGFHLPSPWHPGGATVAADPASGLALLAAAAAAGEESLVHLPDGNRAALRAVAAAGFQERWRTTRMRLGPPVAWRPSALFGAHSLFWG
jgi:GNAT superfamily N-acetyltransferase